MQKWSVIAVIICVSALSGLTARAADNASFFEDIIPDNASLSAVKDSGGKVLDAGEDVLENIVDDGKSIGSFLLKKAGDLVEGTKDTVKGAIE